MPTVNIYTKSLIDKLGNAMVYLCEHMQPLTKTKALKLIYLIEELSVKRYGLPFFNLRFDVWRLGPVSRDLFVELSGEPALLGGFIEKSVRNNITYISAKQAFSDDEFSDIEIDILKQVAVAYAHASADDLINLTHRKHSPWFHFAQVNGFLELFEQGLASTTDVEIDLSVLLQGDEQKLAIYQSHKEFLINSTALKF